MQNWRPTCVIQNTVARVNRVFRDKQGGLVVDYLGIAAELRRALRNYTENRGKGQPTLDVREALARLEELIAMAREFREAAQRGDALGLNPSELAFYDALADNESATRELVDDILKKIAHELTDKLRNSASVDWQKRESVRARLRNLVRITLRRYKYPPDHQQEAIKLVLEQAERLSDEWTRD